ncbi:MAG: putative phosphotransferase [Candidatus Midichloriaceae bacterium]|jgi:aminoglycoside/choline kinase family phosphotransferase|nr:putative phosphotransferase [Candidatus Midichloriaceae bacterium]
MQNEHLGEHVPQHYLSFHRFLAEFGINAYKITPLPADCSARRYYRIASELGSHILMDSSKDPSLGAFIYIASLLKRNGLRTPAILKTDLKKGYLLIEDFGNAVLTKYLISQPELEMPCYELCTKALIKLAKIETCDLQIPPYDPKRLNEGVRVFSEWYLQHNIDSASYPSARDELELIFTSLYKILHNLPKVLSLRDFMADNLMIIENAAGLEKLGILDFQDAVLVNCTYDLLSLLEDARRDVSPTVVQKCKQLFCSELGLNAQEFEDSYTLLSLQRNLRIIGTFHRRNIRDNEPRYLDYLPRVWQFVKASLEKDIAAPFKNWFDKHGISIK